MAELTIVGIDLAKSVFHVHGTDARGAVRVRRRFTRKGLSGWLAQLPPCRVAMEACGGAHHWARLCRRLGHEPFIIPAQLVRAFVKSNKNDFADAEAIAEAAARPGMRQVAPKDEHQQLLQALHRARSQLLGQRTATVNHIRGLLLEFGVALPRGVASLRRRLPEVLEDTTLPARLRALIAERWAFCEVLGRELARYDAELKERARTDARCRRLMTVPGIGPLGASALVAHFGDGSGFACGRDLAAALGLVSRQHGTGGRTRLLGISKRGDRYLRSLLIHGARAVVRAVADKADRRSRWVRALVARRGKNIAAVAVANKNARIAWALLRHNTEYRAAA